MTVGVVRMGHTLAYGKGAIEKREERRDRKIIGRERGRDTDNER